MLRSAMTFSDTFWDEFCVNFGKFSMFCFWWRLRAPPPHTHGFFAAVCDWALSYNKEQMLEDIKNNYKNMELKENLDTSAMLQDLKLK